MFPVFGFYLPYSPTVRASCTVILAVCSCCFFTSPCNFYILPCVYISVCVCVFVCLACMIIAPVRGSLWFVLCGCVYFLLQRAGHSGITADLMTHFRGKPLTGIKNSTWTAIRCIFVYMYTGIFESRCQTQYMSVCALMSVSLYCPAVCVCVTVRAVTIFSIVTEAFCSLFPLCHTGCDCERRPAGLASCTCKHDIMNEGRERLARGRSERRGSLVLYQLLS